MSDDDTVVTDQDLLDEQSYIRTFFDAVDHDWLARMLRHRIADPRVLRLIERWLKAGILESGRWEPVEGSGMTP
jgi:retron-type reverse transcriptase